VPKVSAAHKASRRDQILDGALACFIERGFQRTSMADVFEATGLSAGAVYSYFGSKQELAVAVAKRAMSGQLEHLAASPPDTPMSPSMLLRTVAGGFERIGVPTSIIVQLWGEATVDPEFHAIAADALVGFRAGFRAVLLPWAAATRGLTDTEAEAWVDSMLPIMIACGQGFLLQSHLLPDFDAEQYLAAVERLLG